MRTALIKVLARLNRDFNLRGIVYIDDVAAAGVRHWMWCRRGGQA